MTGGRFDARAYERSLLARLRERRRAGDGAAMQMAMAVAYARGVLEGVAELEQGARRTAKEAAVARALAAFCAEID